MKREGKPMNIDLFMFDVLIFCPWPIYPVLLKIPLHHHHWFDSYLLEHPSWNRQHVRSQELRSPYNIKETQLPNHPSPKETAGWLPY